MKEMTNERTYFADTSFLIDLLRGNEDAVAVHRDLERFITGTICLYEINKVSDVDMSMFAPNRVVSFGRRDAEIAGEIYQELEREGAKIGETDVLIAAQAAGEGRTIVTRDEDFDKIERVECLFY